MTNHPDQQRTGLSRRQLLQLMGAGAGAAALTPLLSGQNVSAATATRRRSASTAGSGETIIYSVQSFAHDPIKPVIDAFTAETGINVQLETGPATGQDLLTQLIPAFSAGSTPYDVVDVDDPACAALIQSGFLEPLDDVLTSDITDDFLPGLTLATDTWNRQDDSTYRVYHNYETGYYWLRQDVLDANGASAPTSWDELVSVGTDIRKATGMYAFADAASKPGLMFVYMAYLTAQSGGDLYSFDDATKQAFQFAYDLIHTHDLFPADAITWTYDQLNSAYLGDQLMSMREWTFFDGVARDATDWYDPSKVAIVAPPAGPAGPKTWGGGWGLTVPAAGDKKESAKAFVAYMSRPDVATQLAAASSFFVTARQSVFDELGDSGMVKALKDYSEGDYISPRPFHPKAAQAEAVIDDIGQSLLTDQISIDDAMSQGRDQIDAL